jgi:MFS family permease
LPNDRINVRLEAGAGLDGRQAAKLEDDPSIPGARDAAATPGSSALPTFCARLRTMPEMPAQVPSATAPVRPALAFIVILAGVCAALHVGKLPPAITALQQSLGIGLVQAGFLLSGVQVAGMTAGVAFGALADGLGLKRSMVLGLVILALASALGAGVRSTGWLLALRALEGLGFLLVVLPAPGLVRRLVPPARVHVMLGVWGAFMPFGTALALLIGPLWIEALGWRAWWLALAAVALAMAVWLARAVPSRAGSAPAVAPESHAGSLASPAVARESHAGSPTARATPAAPSWFARRRQTLARRGPWLVAITFAAYSSQWLAVIGFLPTIYLQAGIAGATTGVLTALAAAVNMIGNLGAGRLLHRGVRPPTLLATGFVVMGMAAIAAFAGGPGAGLPAWARYAAVLAFSMVGGLIPATLFALALRVAPSEQTISSTVGWVQQWSAFGQFAGPPLVAWVASRAGGWEWTWTVTGAVSLLGWALAGRIGRTVEGAQAEGEPGKPSEARRGRATGSR